MHCPRLSELPPPPPGRTGWPWIEETPPATEAGPRISIVTPSFNQGQYLEETIRSVLLQGYPDIEYIVVDGGSHDDSLAIIQKYAPWLTGWVSEPDHGQTHAINKGLARVTGKIFNFINSDDYLAAGTLRQVAPGFSQADAVAGVVVNFDANSRERMVQRNLTPAKMILCEPDSYFHQPAFWLDTAKLRACGGFDESLHYAFDWDLTIRYLDRYPRVHYLSTELAYFRLHPTSKTCATHDRFWEEHLRVVRQLQSTGGSPTVRQACDLRLRKLGWCDQVGRLLEQRGRRLGRAWDLARATCQDPQVRLSRLTLGAMRRVLFT